jgi:hypothetical protein
VSSQSLRRCLAVFLVLLIPIGWLATKFDPYQLDGDAVAYMDIGDLIRGHQWAGVANAYWHPLYPACLALAHAVFHATRWNELGAYYAMNYVIFLASVVAMLAFVSALEKLRRRMLPSADQDAGGAPLLSLHALRLLGVALVVIGSQRELSMGKVRTDALLETLMLAAFAMLLQTLATESLMFAPLMGLFFGLAYLTKSFALVVALLSIAVMMLFQWWLQRRSLQRAMASGALALVVFGLVAGPYVAALSKQKHRLTFGDSGALNYTWFVSGTEKMHLEPWMTNDFGSASVHLLHPEKQLMATPGVYSYRAEPYGTYPVWFDPTYFNDRIVPRFNAARLLHRDSRNVALAIRYVLNHPEAPILLVLLLVCGARFGFGSWRREGFWLPMVVLGAAMGAIYGMVNVEERYVTLAYLVLVLPVFAALRAREEVEWRRSVAGAMIVLLAFLAVGESLRVALERRRVLSVSGTTHAWNSPSIFGAARGLEAMGVQPGDEIACMGPTACIFDPYWARLAGVRVVTEIYNPDQSQMFAELENLQNRQQVYDVVKGQGAKVLVAVFNPAEVAGRTPVSEGWVRLGGTDFYALPLNLKVAAPAAAAVPAWGSVAKLGP